MHPHSSIIALDSNPTNPVEQVRVTLAELGTYPGIRLEEASPLHLTESVDRDDQPDFVNAVCTVRTSLNGVALLVELNRIEVGSGRECSFRNVPRILDLDIIDLDGARSDDPHLILPHPRAYERSFVMLSLAETLPDFELGEHDCTADSVQASSGQGIRPLRE